MIGIHHDICTHHIYTDNSKPITKCPRRINLVLKNIVKEEIEKLLRDGFCIVIHIFHEK